MDTAVTDADVSVASASVTDDAALEHTSPAEEDDADASLRRQADLPLGGAFELLVLGAVIPQKEEEEPAAEMKKPAEEMKKPPEEMKKPPEEEEPPEEMKKPAEEMKKPAEEMTPAEKMKKPNKMKKPPEEMEEMEMALAVESTSAEASEEVESRGVERPLAAHGSLARAWQGKIPAKGSANSQEAPPEDLDVSDVSGLSDYQSDYN
ncbi:unnamed protein product [Effrenium voratum]|uniref:Uncharacterized protein n=1 Tax=Effrenium voratum TaxID=2562239 RepID=A0AA36IPP2_9DINO|nr:unnamed protein product [Effrenium voratum]